MTVVAWLHLRSRNRSVALAPGGARAARAAYEQAVAEGRPMFRVHDVNGEELLLAVDLYEGIESEVHRAQREASRAAQVSHE